MGDYPDLANRTAAEYVKGTAGMTIPDEALYNILYDRGVNPDTLVSTLSLKERLLLKADTYVYCATMPGTTSSVEDVDGNWKHKEGGGQITDSDKKYWLKMANGIYSMYGEATVDTGFPKIHSIGMRIWRKSNGIR